MTIIKRSVLAFLAASFLAANVVVAQEKEVPVPPRSGSGGVGNPASVHLVGTYVAGWFYPGGQAGVRIEKSDGTRVTVLDRDNLTKGLKSAARPVVDLVVYPCSPVLDGPPATWCLRSVSAGSVTSAELPLSLIAGKIQDSVKIADGTVAYLICGASINPAPPWYARGHERELQSWALNGQCIIVAHPLRTYQVSGGRVSGTLPDGQYHGTGRYVRNLPDGMKVRGQMVSVPLFDTNQPATEKR